MNGLSDIRLLLRTDELLNESGQPQARFSAPADLGIWAMLAHRLRTRRTLLELDADQLKDIGLDPLQARREGLKPFWRG